MATAVLSIENKKNVIAFSVIFSNLKKMFEETNIYLRESGMYIQIIDSTHACMCEIKLDASWFDKYEIKHDVVFGINLEVFDKIINCLDRNYTITIQYDENSDKVKIILTNGEIFKIFDMCIIMIDADLMDIPEVEYSADIIMKSAVFKDYFKEFVMFGEYVKINCDEENITFDINGENTNYKIIVKDKYLEEYAIEEDVSLSPMYNLSYISFVTSFIKLNTFMSINISENYPLKLEYKIKDGKQTDNDKNESKENPEETSTFGSMKFYIAPRIDDD